MNPVALLSMIAISAAWIGLGYEAIQLGAWVGLVLYVLVLIAATNPSLWRLAGRTRGRARPR